MDADERLCRAHRLDQRTDAHDGHDTFEIIGQHVQRHFGADLLQRFRLEVGIAHPVFDGAERVLGGFAPRAHLFRVLVEASLDGLEKVFVFPAGDPALFARGATMLDGAALAGVGPVREAVWPRRAARSELL